MTSIPLPPRLPAAKPGPRLARPADTGAGRFHDALKMPRERLPRTGAETEAIVGANRDPARLSLSLALEKQAVGLDASRQADHAIADRRPVDDDEKRGRDEEREEASPWRLIPMQEQEISAAVEAAGTDEAAGTLSYGTADSAEIDPAATRLADVDEALPVTNAKPDAFPIPSPQATAPVDAERSLAATPPAAVLQPTGTPRPMDPTDRKAERRDALQSDAETGEPVTVAARGDSLSGRKAPAMRRPDAWQEAGAPAHHGMEAPAQKPPPGVVVLGEQTRTATPPAAQPATLTVVANLGADASWAAYFRETAVHGTTPPASVNSLKIQLNPAELGMVTAHLRFADDNLSVELHADTMEAHRQLSADADQIVRSLRALGMDVDRVTVHHQPQTDARQPSGQSAGEAARGFGGAGGSGEGHGTDSGRGSNGRQTPGDNLAGENHALADARAAGRDGGGRYI